MSWSIECRVHLGPLARLNAAKIFGYYLFTKRYKFLVLVGFDSWCLQCVQDPSVNVWAGGTSVNQQSRSTGRKSCLIYNPLEDTCSLYLCCESGVCVCITVYYCVFKITFNLQLPHCIGQMCRAPPRATLITVIFTFYCAISSSLIFSSNFSISSVLQY